MDWFYSENNQQHGPVSEEVLANLYRTGTVKGSDLIWSESMSEWTPISKVAAFASIQSSSGPSSSSAFDPTPASTSPTLIDEFPPATPPSPTSFDSPSTASYAPPSGHSVSKSVPGSSSEYRIPLTKSDPSGHSVPKSVPGSSSEYRIPLTKSDPSGHSVPAPVPGATPPPNYLWQAIVVTVLCCLPFGIPALIFSTKVNSALAVGDMEGATAYSKKAKFWCILALVVGLIVTVISIAITAVGAMSGMMQGLQEIQSGSGSLQ